jgi:hypothetical protein
MFPRARSLFVSFSGLTLLAGASSAQLGSVLRAQRIDVLDPLLEGDDYLGASIATLGDLDGDGVTDIAVSAPHTTEFLEVNTEAGSVWVLFLAADGTVRSFTEISRGTGGFTGSLPDGAQFGSSVEAVGDLDGDGRAELAVTSYEPNPVNPNRRPVGVYLWILVLDSGGHVRHHARILHTDPVFQPPIDSRDLFALAGRLGDTDGDGVSDLALDASSDDAGPGANAGAFWILRLNADGTARSALRIGRESVAIRAEDYFGHSVSRLGDLDRDGNAELAVSALQADDRRGSVWILSMRPDQSVLRAVELDRDDFDTIQPKGLSVAALGDLDGDQATEIVVALPDYFTGQPQRDVGGLLVAFLAADGSVKKRLIITRHEGGFSLPLPQGTGFGREVEPLGDLDGDGNPEIATGGIYFDDDRGTLWILSLRASAVRNGRGVNTVELREKEEPSIGTFWRGALDCRGHAPGVAWLVFHEAPLLGLRTSAGELLVQGRRIGVRQAPHAGTQVQFDELIPRDVALINVAVHAQGVCTGAPGPRLSNALDMLIGR